MVDGGRSRAKSRLAAAAQSRETAFISETLTGTITQWSLGAEALYGYAVEEALGQHVSLIVPDDRRGELEQLLELAGRGEWSGPLETVRIARTGERRHVSLTVGPITDARGKIVGASVIAHDITDRVRSTERLVAAEAELRALNATLEQRVAERTELLQLLHEVAAAATVAPSAGAALDTIIDLVCRSRRWTAGHLYWSPADSEQLVSTNHWYVAPGRDLRCLVRESRERRFARGEGVIGSVAAAGRPVWVEDLARETEYVRTSAVVCGLRTAVFVPVLVDQTIRAVLEFYSEARVPHDAQVLETLVDVGTHVGLVIARHQLEKQLSELADEEERRIGGELHDRVGQSLTAAGLLARSLQRRLESRSATEAADAAVVVEAVEETKEHVRNLARSLVPAEIVSDGLLGALEDLLRRYEATSGIACRLSSPPGFVMEDKFAATQLLRIVQEAVANAVAHGRGSRVQVELATGHDGLHVTVHDDGRGPPKATRRRGGIGLLIMRHRAALIGGSIEIGKGKLGGTTVTCSLPPL